MNAIVEINIEMRFSGTCLFSYLFILPRRRVKAYAKAPTIKRKLLKKCRSRMGVKKKDNTNKENENALANE